MTTSSEITTTQSAMKRFLESAFPGVPWSERHFNHRQEGTSIPSEKQVQLKVTEEQRLLIGAVAEVMGLSQQEVMKIAFAILMYYACKGEFPPHAFMFYFINMPVWQQGKELKDLCPTGGDCTRTLENFTPLHTLVADAMKRRSVV